MVGGIISFILIGIAGAFGVWLIFYIIKKLYKLLLAIILGFVIFIGIGFFYAASTKVEEETSNNETNLPDSAEYQNNENNFEEEKGENTEENGNFIRQNLNWTDYYNKKFSINYKIEQADYERARNNRSHFTGYSWGEIYQNLYDNDRSMLASVYSKFNSLKKDYDALDFAKLIVSSIQEVPYTWILIDACESAPNRAEIQHSGYTCLGNIKNYAVLSPAEFLVTHKGDCDTKTMVLYTILKRFNYDVCVLVSEQYAHAMLGINIPATGKYIGYQGKRYYVWETTVKGMDVGLMAPEYSNLSLWDVALN